MTMYLYQSSTCVAHCGPAWVFLVGGLEKTPSCRGYLQGSCIGSWWIPVINEPTLAEIHIVSPNQLAKTRLCHVFYPIQDSMFMFFLVNTHVSFPGAKQPVNLPQPTTFRHPFRLREEQVALGKLVTGWQLIRSDLLKYQMPIKCVCHHFFVPVSGIFLWMFWIYISF